MNPIWQVIIVAALGVLLPKVLPALVLPKTLPGSLSNWLEFLPAATLGAFTGLTIAGFVMPTSRPWLVLGALALTGMVAVISRRMVPTLLAGCTGLAALHVVRVL